jgi:LysM repeat protein
MPLIAVVAATPLLLGAPHWSSYTVQPGDTLWDIAQRHHTDVRTLARANHLAGGGHLIRAGAHLRVPGQVQATHHRSRPAAKATARYTVRSGDTISQIATRYRVSPGSLLRLNHLDSRGRIYAGQHLKVPAAAVKAQQKRAAAKAAALRWTSYRVRSGDTLSAIAARTGTSLATLLKINHLHRSSIIHPGQVVKVSRHKPASTSSSFAGRTYPAAVVAAADANRHRLSSRAVPSRAATKKLIVRTAQRYGVDPALALAVGYQESGWNQRQVSVANAIGTMQVIPSTGRWASSLVGRRLDLLDTRDNITAGVVVLKALTASAKNRDHAIAGYYQGLSSVQRNGMFADTKVYVRNVRALTEQLG